MDTDWAGNCQFLICGFLYLLIDADSELRHIQTIDHQGHKYPLAVSSDSRGWDYEVITYIVFECDDTGGTCSELTTLQLEIDPIEPYLVLSIDRTNYFYSSERGSFRLNHNRLLS